MSELANKLIAENKRTKAKTLDLTNCGLSRILVKVGELVWLESLYFSNGWYGPEFEEHTSANVGPANQILTNLRVLQNLVGLRRLILAAGEDISPLARLAALESLYLAGSHISDLTPLASLSALQSLDLSDTQVSDLSPLLNLIRGGCPVKWSSKSWKGPGIYVEDCPLTNPPPAIVQQGNDAILNYFAERGKSGVHQLHEAKMLIVGEGGAGKTSLLRRLYQRDQPMPTENESTKGIAIHPHFFLLKNGRTFRLNVWDFGGQEIYHATHQFFLTHRSLYVLLDDTRKDDKSVQDHCFRYWLGLVEVFGGGSPVLIFQNEKSGRSKSIDLDGIKGRYTNVIEKHQGDLANEHAADRLRDAIEYFAANLSHIGEELPAPWIKIRADIEERAEREPYISQREYFNIYQRHLEFDESKALSLSQYLHDLGVFLGCGTKVARMVPCPCETCTQAPPPHFFDHGYLVRRLSHGKVRGECGKSYQEMDVVQLLYQLPGWAKGEPGERPAPLRLFLASSSELREDRDAFELYLRQRNDELRKQGVYLEIVRWENFLDAMSDTRLQDEYNKAVRTCDVFVALFFTKAGTFTDEEFDAAYGQFKASGKPKIFTYFRNANVKTGSARRDDLNSLWIFQDKLKNLGHYQSNYDNTADLKLQFRDQLDKLIESSGDAKARRTGA